MALRQSWTMELPRASAPPDEEKLWRKLRRLAGRLPFAEDLVAAWYCAIDRNTPTSARMIIWGAVAYFILPCDAIPDVVAGLGFTDDGTVLAAAIAMVGQHLQPEHRRRARARLDRLAD